MQKQLADSNWGSFPALPALCAGLLIAISLTPARAQVVFSLDIGEFDDVTGILFHSEGADPILPTNSASFAFGMPVPVEANVTDAAGVASAQLLVDGIAVGSDGSAPYQFTATGLAAGARVLSVVGVDTGGNRATNSVTITVQPQTDFTSPRATITAPTNGSSFAFGVPIQVSATVTDNVAVAEAQLRLNGDWQASDTDAPYGFDLAGLTPGSYTLEVIGTDRSFNTATSSILVSVVAPPSGSYTNLDFIMSPFSWKPATNAAPPHPDAAINFGSATNVAWEWDNSSGDYATVTYGITRTTTGGPNGAEVYFFGGFKYNGTVDHLHLSTDVSRSTIASQNIGNFHFALRQGTNLFHTSQGLNNVPSVAGPLVNYDLSGLATMTLKTNGVNALTGLTWTPRYAGTGPDLTNGLPLEFGFSSSGSLGSSATTTLRGPQLDNYRVEISGVAMTSPPPPVLQISAVGAGHLQLVWNAPGFRLQSAVAATGPWTTLDPQPASPYLLDAVAAARFYRLQWDALQWDAL